MILVKFQADWSDEFDVYGFRVFEKDEWLKLVHDFIENGGIESWYFGSNEGWECEWDTEEERACWVRENYTVKGLNSAEYGNLRALFGNSCGEIDYGHFCPLWEE